MRSVSTRLRHFAGSNFVAPSKFSRPSLHTWSPLASAFNDTKPVSNPFSIFKPKAGLFGVEALQEHVGFYTIQEKCVEESDAIVQEILSHHREKKMVELFDELSDCICKVADLAEFIRYVHGDEAMAAAADDANAKMSSLVEKLNTNPTICKALQKVIDEGDVLRTDDLDKYVAQLFMFDFQQSGVHLPGEKRVEFVNLSEKIHTVATSFLQGTELPSAVPFQQLPQEMHKWFRKQGDQLLVDTLCSSSSNSLVREAAFKIFLYPNSQQEELLSKLLFYRKQLAITAGFETYAERAIQGSVAGTQEKVSAFLERLSEELRPKAEADFKSLQVVKNTRGLDDGPLRPWDSQYYSALARQQVLSSEEADKMLSYFSLGSCMEGLSELFNCLYGVRLQVEETVPGEVWEEGVYKLAVVHKTEGVLGHVYCDLFQRIGKPHQDSHYTIVGGRRRADSSYQTPVVVLLMNLPMPFAPLPSLLTPSHVENLFHEFGHAMHSMLGRARYQHVTGTRCSTDFAEVPAVLMEYFALDPRVLRSFAKHYETGDKIPEQLLKKFCVSRKMFKASDAQFQVFYAMLDQQLHGGCGGTASKSPGDVCTDVLKHHYSLPHVANTAWHLRFGHLVGYGAKYYSYLLSKAIASRIWQKCFQKDPFSSSMGERYRYELLQHGGGKPALDMVENVLGGTRPEMSDLVESLIGEIEESQSQTKAELIQS